MWYGFGFWLDGYLGKLFRQSPKVVVKALAPEDIHVPNRFSFEGTLPGDIEVALAYGECGPLERPHGLEKGRIVIGGLALKVVRHFLEAAGGATRVYVGVVLDIDREMPPGKEEICVGRLELGFTFSTPDDYQAELEIRGLKDYSVLTTRTFPSLDSWSIYPEEVRYAGLGSEEKAERPVWLERALKE